MMLKSKRICSVQTRIKSSWWWALGSSGRLPVQIAFCGKSRECFSPWLGVRAASWEDGAVGSCPWAEEGVDRDFHTSLVNVQST